MCRATVTARAAAAKPASSVVVVFELMAYCQGSHVGGILDLVQRNVASASEGDQHLTKERAVAGLSVNERRAAQASLHGVPNRVNRQLRRSEVLYGLGAIEQEVEKPQQILRRRIGAPDFKRRAHPRTDLRRASKRCCSSE